MLVYLLLNKIKEKPKWISFKFANSLIFAVDNVTGNKYSKCVMIIEN